MLIISVKTQKYDHTNLRPLPHIKYTGIQYEVFYLNQKITTCVKRYKHR